MSRSQAGQFPKSGAPPEQEARTQYGALCWRRGRGGVRILLITSRDTGRWVIPKGWPMPGLPPQEAAAREAFEEAGVQGKVGAGCLGLYPYDKAISRDPVRPVSVPCMVAVYSLEVTRLLDRFPESRQRRRKWVSPAKAATLVQEAELQSLLAEFSPPRVEDSRSPDGGE